MSERDRWDNELVRKLLRGKSETRPTLIGTTTGGGGNSTTRNTWRNPMTDTGDLIVGLAHGAPGRLGKGAEGQVLTVVGGLLAWADPTGGGSGGGPHALGDHTDVDTTTIPPEDGDVLTWDALLGEWVPEAPSGGASTPQRVSVVWNLDEGGVPSVGQKAVFNIPFATTIVDWIMLADAAGNIEVIPSLATYDDYPTFTSLVGSGTAPALTSSQKARMSTLTGWTTTLPADSNLTIEILSQPVDLAFLMFALILERV